MKNRRKAELNFSKRNLRIAVENGPRVEPNYWVSLRMKRGECIKPVSNQYQTLLCYSCKWNILHCFGQAPKQNSNSSRYDLRVGISNVQCVTDPFKRRLRLLDKWPKFWPDNKVVISTGILYYLEIFNNRILSSPLLIVQNIEVLLQEVFVREEEKLLPRL